MLQGKDKLRADNLMRALSSDKCSFNLKGGDEVRLLAASLDWLVRLTREGHALYFDEPSPKLNWKKVEDLDNGQDHPEGEPVCSSAEQSAQDGAKPKEGAAGAARRNPSPGSAAGGIRKLRDASRSKPRAKKGAV